MSILSKLFPKAEVVKPSVPSVYPVELVQIRVENALPEMSPDGEDVASQLYYARIIATPKGYAYEVCKGGEVQVRQDYRPDAGGFQVMTRDEAVAYAQAVIRSYQGGA